MSCCRDLRRGQSVRNHRASNVACACVSAVFYRQRRTSDGRECCAAGLTCARTQHTHTHTLYTAEQLYERRSDVRAAAAAAIPDPRAPGLKVTKVRSIPNRLPSTAGRRVRVTITPGEKAALCVVENWRENGLYSPRLESVERRKTALTVVSHRRCFCFAIVSVITVVLPLGSPSTRRGEGGEKEENASAFFPFLHEVVLYANERAAARDVRRVCTVGVNAENALSRNTDDDVRSDGAVFASVLPSSPNRSLGRVPSLLSDGVRIVIPLS